jgi:hypothetical protein
MAFALFPLGERNTGLQFNWFNILLHWAQVAQGEWPEIREDGSSDEIGDLQILRAIRDQFVAEGFANGAIFDEENARHPFDIARGSAEPMAIAPGFEGAQNTLVIEELPPVGTQQAEGFVELATGIGNARDGGQAVGSEKLLRLLIVIGKMNENELCAEGFDLGTQFGDVVNGFAAEGTAEVAENNEEDGALTGEVGNGLASLRFVILQKRGINIVGRHFRLAFPDFGR